LLVEGSDYIIRMVASTSVPPPHPRFIVRLSETAVIFVPKSRVMMARRRRLLLSGIILAVVVLLLSPLITVPTNALQINQHQHQHHQHQQFRTASSPYILSSSPSQLSSSSSSLFMSKKEEDEETSSSSSSLSSSSGLAWNKFPFFATQQQESSQEQLKEGQRGAASAAAITTRLPIGKLFDASRDYIFNTATNVRGYEWTKKETEELLDDLMDAAEQEREKDYDYELNQIVLIPMDWDREALGLGNRYDVYDGQQRLVTLCLIFAGIRQFLLQFNNSDSNNDIDMEATTKELADMLSPPKTRKQEVVRIELNTRDNEILSYILTGDLEQVQAIVSHNYTPQQLTKKYSNSNRQILTNYQVILARLSALEDSESNAKDSLFTKDYVLQLLDFIIEKVYLLVCIPESAAIARNIVMGQGKGKDNEIIDDFKGLVCFRYTQDEQSMYKTFDAWDDLSSSCSSMIDLDSGIVGRDVVTNACLWRATSFLKTKIGKRNQLLCLEKWMRGNIMQSRNGYQDCSGGGDQFFLKQIKPASLVLGYFRDGSLPPQLISSTAAGKTKSDSNKLFMVKIEISLRFLRDLILDVSAATKEIEMIVIELLLRATNRNKKMPLRVLHQHLLATEQLALYFALLKPSASVKYQKCFELLDRIEDQASSSSSSSIVPSSTHLMKTVWEEQKVELRNALVLNDFGATAGGKKFAVALLKRLNRDVMIQQSGDHFSSDRMMKQVLFGGDKNTYLEPVLPAKATKKAWGGVDSWPEKIQREKSIPKLGNLCLVGRTDNKKPTTKELKSSFEEKKGRYKEEMWPLTSRLASIDTWNDNSMTQTTAVLIGLVNSIWGLPLD